MKLNSWLGPNVDMGTNPLTPNLQSWALDDTVKDFLHFNMKV